ncbi:MAG: branched-chain amino acid ABC transporter permease [Microgenomates group bacterium]|jgi:branched-chain amino acid transport system permease protein
MAQRNFLLFAAVGLLFVLTGILMSWNVSLQILNIGVLSAIMALGVNMQWGYAGLFSTGIMGSVALGGLAVVLVSSQPNPENWAAGGPQLLMSLALGVAVIAAAIIAAQKMALGRARNFTIAAILILGFFAYRYFFDQASLAIETINPENAGNLGGLGLPSYIAWIVGALMAAAAAWVIGKTALGLRSDYLAIATLGIAEITLAVMKNEDWLARGVKNVIKLPRPGVPYEVDLQQAPWFLSFANNIGADPITASTIFVKLVYLVLFGAVLLGLIWLSERALHSPWGRMMRAIRDNEDAARAMGKNVKARHLQIFILGAAVVGLAGAMLTSMEGQLTPGNYSPLRFTFLIWVMVIVGGSGNNLGSVLGGLLIAWLWLIVENAGPVIMSYATYFLPDGGLKSHLVESAAQLRLLTLGVILLVVLRFSPKGLIPEK